jgi:DNA-binding transcriptional MocR family regulator
VSNFADGQDSRRWHKDSVFGEGPRVPLDYETGVIWQVRLQIHNLAGRITDAGQKVARALFKRLGVDGRCDPSHATLADDCGKSIATVKRALKALKACGMVWWTKRLVREGWRTEQTSNAYMLTLGETPEISAPRCDAQSERLTDSLSFSKSEPVSELSTGAQREAQAALAEAVRRRQAAVARSLLSKGRGSTA